MDGTEAALIAALDSFNYLKRVDLGYLPIEEEDPYQLDCVRHWARGKGVKIAWQGCSTGEDEYGCECGEHDCWEDCYGSEDEICYNPRCHGDCGFSHGRGW